MSIRELVGSLEACDAGTGSGVRLETGQLVNVLGILCRPLGGPEADPYLTEFECGGRTYTCPLYQFQARTQIVEPELAQAVPEQKATAV